MRTSRENLEASICPKWASLSALRGSVVYLHSKHRLKQDEKICMSNGEDYSVAQNDGIVAKWPSFQV